MIRSMFVCECPHCGRRELRGARSLHPLPAGDGIDWVAHCRACGQAVTIAESRRRSAACPTAPREPELLATPPAA